MIITPKMQKPRTIRGFFSFQSAGSSVAGDHRAAEELAKSVVQARRATGQIKSLCYEPDVLAFATEIYGAIPEVPFQACDIIRDEATGKLYVLEINPGGNTWVFSRENTAKVVAELGGFDITQQFNAFETIANTLIERTRLEAE